MRILSIIFIFVLFFSCKESPKSSAVDGVGTEAATAEDTKTTSPANNNVNELLPHVGKMPSEADVFNLANLGERIKKIMGKHYINYNSGWFDKLPLQKYEDYIFFGGCEFENCDGVKYFIIVDLTENNVNVLHYGGKRGYSFEEGAIIGMPDYISDAFDKFRK